MNSKDLATVAPLSVHFLFSALFPRLTYDAVIFPLINLQYSTAFSHKKSNLRAQIKIFAVDCYFIMLFCSRMERVEFRIKRKGDFCGSPSATGYPLDAPTGLRRCWIRHRRRRGLFDVEPRSHQLCDCFHSQGSHENRKGWRHHRDFSIGHNLQDWK